VDLGIAGIEVIDTIGRGGSSVVYRASQPLLGRTVAVKVLHTAIDNPAMRSSFDKECQALGRLSSCPEIVTIFDAGWTQQDQPYLIMPYMAGTLRDRLAAGATLDLTQMMALAESLLTGLHEAHEHGVLHRDIKPANVFLDEHGRTYLGDFGIASVVDVTSTNTSAFSGTPLFAPPEAFAGLPADRRRDVYSAAATLRAAVTGKPPFNRTTGDLLALMHAVVNEAPTPVGAHIPAAVVAVLDRAMAKEPSARQASAIALLSELRHAVVEADDATIVRSTLPAGSRFPGSPIRPMPPLDAPVAYPRSVPAMAGVASAAARPDARVRHLSRC
jgi:serine/threonine protein kinase